MKLFDEMPRLEGERVLLREFAMSDADALEAFAHSERIYQTLPAFLYEQKYPDACTCIERMREECFDTKESILLAICLREAPDEMLGIAEIYAYDEQKPKASIGIRLFERAWGQGIATEAAGLLKRYLRDRVGVRTITAHVLVENKASARALEKNGFRMLYGNIMEDWGLGDLVAVDKWVYKRRWDEGHTEP